MQIDKNTVIELLKSLGKHEEANHARNDLPDQVDPDRDSGILSRFGIDPSMLKNFIGGAGSAGGLLDKAKDMFKG